jgi:hypothetical protein
MYNVEYKEYSDKIERGTAAEMAENTDTGKKITKAPKEKSEGKAAVSSKRVFGDQTYQTDLRVFASKEDAKDVITYLKLKDKSLKARIVEKGTGAYLYYDESSYPKIELMILPIPSIEGVRREILRLTEEAQKVGEKPKKSAPKKKTLDPSFSSGSLDSSNASNPSSGSNTSNPSNGSNTSNPSSGSNTSNPSSGSNTSNPSSGSNTTNPSSGSNTSNLSNESNQTSISDNSTTSAQEEKPLKIRKKKSTIVDQTSPNISSPKSKDAEIISRISYERPESIPEYLLTRLSKDARIFMKIGILEIERTSKKKLEYAIGLLRAEQVKYDITFEKDRGVIDYINHISKLMNERVQKYQEEECQGFIQKEIIGPMEKGKFNKYLSDLNRKGIDETGYLISKSLKGKLKNYPYTEAHLVKHIKKLIEERTKTKTTP